MKKGNSHVWPRILSRCSGRKSNKTTNRLSPGLTACARSMISCLPTRAGTDWRSFLELDDNLKKLMKDLGAAINDALSDSSEISGAIQNVRDSGYDVFLVLEATIGFNRRSSEDVEEASGQAVLRRDIELNVNAQDMKFLKSLKIKVDDLESQ